MGLLFAAVRGLAAFLGEQICVALPGEELDARCPLLHRTCGNESVENSLTHPDLLLSPALKVCLLVRSSLSPFQDLVLCAGVNTLAYRLFLEDVWLSTFCKYCYTCHPFKNVPLGVRGV